MPPSINSGVGSTTYPHTARGMRHGRGRNAHDAADADWPTMSACSQARGRSLQFSAGPGAPSSMSDIFCKIIAGQIPSQPVYQDDRCYVIRCVIIPRVCALGVPSTGENNTIFSLITRPSVMRAS